LDPSDSKAHTTKGLIKTHHTIDHRSQEIVFEWPSSSMKGDWVKAGVEYVSYNPMDGSMWLRSVRHYTRTGGMHPSLPDPKSMTSTVMHVEFRCDLDEIWCSLCNSVTMKNASTVVKMAQKITVLQTIDLPKHQFGGPLKHD